MKKTYLLALIIMSVIFLGNTATAQVSSTTPTNRVTDLKQRVMDIKQQAVDERMRLKNEIASTTANLKNMRQEVKQDIRSSIEIKIGKRLDEQKLRVAGPFEKAIQNLKDLVVRIESRMAKMKTDGIDISNSERLLIIAKTNITLAETELTNLANLLSENIPTAGTSTIRNAERKDLLQRIRAQSEKTKIAIRTAHKSIISVVTSLKVGLLRKATSTREEISTSTNI